MRTGRGCSGVGGAADFWRKFESDEGWHVTVIEGLATAHAAIAGHEEDAECVVELLFKVCPAHDAGNVVECCVVSEGGLNSRSLDETT